MQTKLTLSLDRDVIFAAKKNLVEEGRSLSSMVEDYFRSLLAVKTKNYGKKSVVSELSGVAKLPKGKDWQDVLGEYLLEKHQ